MVSNGIGKNYKEWDLMEDYYSDTEDNSKVKNFLSNKRKISNWCIGWHHQRVEWQKVSRYKSFYWFIEQ